MTEIVWLGHAAFYIKTDGVSFLIDPWIDNPMAPKHVSEEYLSPDYILVTHAHNDHFGETEHILKSSKKTICICIAEIDTILSSFGVSGNQIIGMNKGGTKVLKNGIKVTAVHADHSSSYTTENGDVLYGGEAMGFIIHTKDNHRIYHTGDTAIFGDMKIINDIYKPDIVCICIGDNYTMGPIEAAYTLNHLLTNVSLAIPMHYKTFGPLTGTPEEVKRLLTRNDIHIQTLIPGTPFSL
ncbi:hypothetical protein WA158_002476 [Blastocystis sp. Blastoise]